MKYKYFDIDASPEETKKKYRALAFEHHPDKGGDQKIMQEINAEYENVIERKSPELTQDQIFDMKDAISTAFIQALAALLFIYLQQRKERN